MPTKRGHGTHALKDGGRKFRAFFVQPSPQVLYRWLVVAAQAAALGITWPLWQVRIDPPLLPALALPQFDTGWLMLVSLAVVLIAPRVGLALHAAVLLLAVLLDQTRLQPEFVSGCFLILATLASPSAQLVGRMHLVALWFFSGFHKLVSAGYYAMVADWLLPQLAPGMQPWVGYAVGGVLAAVELSLGLLLFLPRARRLAAWLALGLHLFVLAALVQVKWNEAIWPWNVALAFAGPALIRPWRESVAADLARAGALCRLAAAALLISPWGYYLGIVDAYLAHCLYSSNLPMAHFRGHELVGFTIPTLRVPLPPTYRTYKAYFHAVAEPGEVMTIDDPRWCARRFGYAHEEIEQPD